MGIPLDVLASMHRWVSTTLDKTGNVQVATEVPNDEGGSVDTWSNTLTGIPFSVADGFGGQSVLEQPLLDRIGTRTPFILTLNPGLDIPLDSRIIQTAPLPSRTFEVVGFPNEGATNQMATRVVAVELG